MASRLRIFDEDVLLVVDVQNDFCPGGRLAIREADAVVPVINRLAPLFRHAVLTQDWHPAGHLSFASSHSGKQPFETITLPYGEQTLWPDHCVQRTNGAEFHCELLVPCAELILRKGFRPEVDSYSAFRENDRKTSTGLRGYLKERGFKRVFAVGLALDVCVRFSAEDAAAAGFDTYVIEDACRAVDPGAGLEAASQAMRKAGVSMIASNAFGA
jgi:nicotinamidase/pyrazinamidase